MGIEHRTTNSNLALLINQNAVQSPPQLPHQQPEIVVKMGLTTAATTGLQNMIMGTVNDEIEAIMGQFQNRLIVVLDRHERG